MDVQILTDLFFRTAKQRDNRHFNQRNPKEFLLNSELRTLNSELRTYFPPSASSCSLNIFPGMWQ